jgi:hypothetical protein
MRRLNAAREWLQRAIAIGGKAKIQQMALDDSDFEPLWDEIRPL